MTDVMAFSSNSHSLPPETDACRTMSSSIEGTDGRSGSMTLEISASGQPQRLASEEMNAATSKPKGLAACP